MILENQFLSYSFKIEKAQHKQNITFGALNPMPKRYFIQLSYLGSAYSGWQIQPNAPSIQATINKALSVLCREPIYVVGCGRTDAGVHAAHYFAHFDCKGEINEAEVLFRVNHVLPHDIAIQQLFEVPESAHARFSAVRRTYKYFIHQKKNPFLYTRSTFYTKKLDFEAMNKAAKVLIKQADFTTFSKVNAQTKTSICDVQVAEWKQENGQWVFTITANRFLRNMVRSIVGTLFYVGTGKITVEEFESIFHAKDRSKGGSSAPGEGLYLWKIEYPDDLLTGEIQQNFVANFEEEEHE